MFDNTFLDEEYIESIIASTPTGMFTDRDIYGKWVSAEGVVYKDFKEKVHYIKEEEFKTKQIKGNMQASTGDMSIMVLLWL